MASETKTEVAVSSKPAAAQGEAPVSPSTQMTQAIEDMERLFGRLMPRNWMAPGNWHWPLWGPFAAESMENLRVPHMDVIDRDKDILIRAEVPGVDRKDLEVSLSNGTLSVRGRIAREAHEQRKDYFRCEISQSDFSRSLSLPPSVDSEKVAAHLKDGVLEITLPKQEQLQRRAVEVK